MNYKAIIFVLAFLVTQAAFAQSSKKKKSKSRATSDQPTTLDPYFPKESYAPKKSRSASKGITYDAEKKFYEQMELVAKEKRKAEKESEKPQYSDPMYFGHKRPPKKHKPGKMKYCKVCGIRH